MDAIEETRSKFLQMSEKEREDMLWENIPKDFVVFDLETTGLNPRRDRIIEIGAVHFNKNDYRATGEINTFQIFLNPGMPIPQEATAINKITDSMVADGASEYEGLTKFFDFVSGKDVYAYNAKFDKDFILESAKRCGFYDEGFSFKPIDILKPIRDKFRTDEFWVENLPKSFKLKTLAKHWEIDIKGAHRAVKDSVMAMQVHVRFMQKLCIEKNISSEIEIKRLQEESEKLKEQIGVNQSDAMDSRTIAVFGVLIFIIFVLLIK